MTKPNEYEVEYMLDDKYEEVVGIRIRQPNSRHWWLHYFQVGPPKQSLDVYAAVIAQLHGQLLKERNQNEQMRTNS
jgi:hypothetical protein